MNMMVKTIWLLAVLEFALSCNGLNKSDNNNAVIEQKTSQPTTLITREDSLKPIVSNDIYTMAAIETCQCIEPMVEKAKHLKEFETNRQIVDMKKVSVEMKEMQPQVQKCTDEIQEKYSRINKNIDEERMLKALNTHCPDMSMLFANFKTAK